MGLVAGLAIVVVIGSAIVGVVVLGVVGGSASARPAPHYVDETATAGVDHTYDGGSTFFVGGGVAVFDCNDDGRPDLYLAGGSNPAALYRNDSPTGGALRFTPLADPVTDLTGVTGAYPLDVDGDGKVDLAVLRVGENELLRGLGDCRFERANEAWGFDGGNEWTTAFSATWEGSAALPTLAFGNYVALDPSGKPSTECADNALVRPNAGGTAYAPAIPLTPGLLHPVDAVQRLGPLRAARPPGHQRPALLRGRRGPAVARRDRRAAPPVHRRRRLGGDADLGHGDRELRRDRRRLSRRLPHQPGRQQAPDADRRARPADLPRHRPQARGDRGTTVHRRRRPALDRLAPRVPGRQQRRVRRPVRVQGQRQRGARLRDAGTRATCSSASRTAPSSRARRRPASSASTVAAAPRSPTSTSTVCSTSWS